ncbi:hypothetical protein J8F10_37860 [Gemmata sp. G18]|uniref:Uncharacterized protein n=1 Tax=Gemmata palustris TaxID=2822762 RepID=A0ABS5C4V1_9BACT|nr:hypothetical protein [Gemmata palustris]MBP3961022.1 hypothetical protein [Gemmata palustris]
MVRELALVVGTMAFAALHLLWYTQIVALWLWELSGGIRCEGRLAVYGASDWAWTTPVHLPAGLIFVSPLGAIGILPLLPGSLLAGFAATELLLTDPSRSISRTGRWRLWLFLLGWAWIPVPASVSWIYQWTVVY